MPIERPLDFKPRRPKQKHWISI